MYHSQEGLPTNRDSVPPNHFATSQESAHESTSSLESFLPAQSTGLSHGSTSARSTDTIIDENFLIKTEEDEPMGHDAFELDIIDRLDSTQDPSLSTIFFNKTGIPAWSNTSLIRMHEDLSYRKKVLASFSAVLLLSLVVATVSWQYYSNHSASGDQKYLYADPANIPVDTDSDITDDSKNGIVKMNGQADLGVKGAEAASQPEELKNEGQQPEGINADAKVAAAVDTQVEEVTQEKEVPQADSANAAPAVASATTADGVVDGGDTEKVRLEIPKERHLTVKGFFGEVQSRFMLENPTRLVVDVTGDSLGSLVGKSSLSDPTIKEIRIGDRGNGTYRIVVELNSDVKDMKLETKMTSSDLKMRW